MDRKSHPAPRYTFVCPKIGISFSLFYNISIHKNKKGLNHMPTLDYVEVFTTIKTKFIYDILLDEENKTVIA